MTANTSGIPYTLIDGLKQFGIASLYVGASYLIHSHFTGNGVASVLWWGSGLSLAALLIGGRRYLWGVFFGALVYNVLVKHTLVGAASNVLASLVEAMVGFELLVRNVKFSASLNQLSDYLRLILWGGGVAGLLGPILGISPLLIAGHIVPAHFWEYAALWWMGDTLGVVLATPLIMVWWRKQSESVGCRTLWEDFLWLGMTFIAGQIIFLGWLNEILSGVPKAFMMFLFITGIALRLDIRATTLALNVAAIQALAGAFREVGYFADEITRSGLHNYWIYMMILSVVGIVLAVYVDDIKQKEIELKDSEHHLRLCQLKGGIGTWEADLATNKEKWSDTCSSLLGFPDLREPTYDDFIAAVHPEDRQRVMDVIQSHVELGKKLEVEYRIVTKNGIRWMRSAGQAEAGADGRNTLLRGVVQDVTERIQAEEALRESERLLKESQNI
ncbi:MAG: MASE1 domain-containing protein, partial [Gammaproteobacteria bacterium]